MNRESRCTGTGRAHDWGKENLEMIERASLSSKGKLENGKQETEHNISNKGSNQTKRGGV